jgi:hypothetical protein
MSAYLTVSTGDRAMTTVDLTEERLAELLVEAKEAHSRYEAETGEYDEDWPRWYARYILDRLRPSPDAIPEPGTAKDPMG